jgi:hypothetical protein
MTPRDGQRVRWEGYPGPNHRPGDEGRVLTATETYSQVMWTTGSQANRVEAVLNEHLSPAGRNPIKVSVDDSLEFASDLSRTAIRTVVSEEGVPGLLRYATTTGALWSTGTLSEDIVEFAQRQAAENPEVVEVASHLDADDRAAFIAAVASAVLLEASKGDSDV